MIQLQYITSERTKERRLFYRFLMGRMDASGALSVAGAEWGPWTRVPEKTLDEAAIDDLIESGGIQNAP